jgi:hypothetical protein
MIVAQEKKKNNIGEYILYMWQVEDLIRTLKFDIGEINAKLVSQYQVDEQQKEEIRSWYQNLALMMQKEQLQQTGHLQFLVNTVNELEHFHQALIKNGINSDYSRLYNDVKGDIDMLRNKSNQHHHDIEVALNTLYIILMLKMKQQEVSEGTQMAVWKFGNFIGHLSSLYKAYESGELEMDY